jgi:protein O-GlcNAc transferase
VTPSSPRAPQPLPPQLQAQLLQAFGQHQRGDLAAAERGYREILGPAPGCFDAAHLLGVVLIQRSAFEEGIARLRQAIAIDGSQWMVRVSLARALLDTHESRAALDCCDVLVGLQPNSADAWFVRGNALQQLGSHAQAVEDYDRALALRPNFPAALNNQGHSLRSLRSVDRALAAFERALALQPAYPQALNNRGLALLDLRRVPEALKSFDEALMRQPEFREALANRGAALLALKRFAEAAQTFERLVHLAADFGGAAGQLLYARRNGCDWREYEELTQRVVAGVQRGALADLPLSFLCVTDSPQAQLACATRFAALKYPARPAAAVARSRRPGERIRVAYVSGDFGDHAVAHALAGVLEHHDVGRFDTVGVSWGRRHEGPMRARLERAFGRFIDATELSDSALADQLRELEVDIAIDLMGHTSGQRTAVFAERCAPVQVNYLGYPGTCGAPYMDYIIADRCVIPEGAESSYNECVARLPCCYLPNDDRRAAAFVTRAELGLPEAAWVFCAFNNPLKITPAIFDVWMRLLREVGSALLWLRAGAPEARRNLEQAARERGVDPSRLVFAGPVESMAVHLGRHRLADLFLDTHPYNGHSTACDALWAGLPVLTCRGRSFASRVGASLLQAADLPELIADSLEAYARLALTLAREPARLGGMREKLTRRRAAGTLFDTADYCRHFEAALTTMADRQRRGLPPQPI